MSNIRKIKKRVSFKEENEIINNLDGKRSSFKTSILKGKGKKDEKIQEIASDKKFEELKVGEINKDEVKKEEKANDNKNEENKIEIPYKTISNNKMKNLSTEDYFRFTIQTELEQGLLNIAMLHPSNPIKFLGNYLIEKSKNKTYTL